ncbi:hypothetical protein CYMTET_48448 [Cymbomonas tetramitiformis]|uniref:Uncharacterized protein n=1 Tax=Cymbomonas tetramitiformis TaxID=36881 RepID=A0AAE0BU12_9CHLO|nr:hypothetical protein CYMTET_48448 [Cymbomonas tetramitiformis]
MLSTDYRTEICPKLRSTVPTEHLHLEVLRHPTKIISKGCSSLKISSSQVAIKDTLLLKFFLSLLNQGRLAAAECQAKLQSDLEMPEVEPEGLTSRRKSSEERTQPPVSWNNSTRGSRAPLATAVPSTPVSPQNGSSPASVKRYSCKYVFGEDKLCVVLQFHGGRVKAVNKINGRVEFSFHLSHVEVCKEGSMLVFYDKQDGSVYQVLAPLVTVSAVVEACGPGKALQRRSHRRQDSSDAPTSPPKPEAGKELRIETSGALNPLNPLNLLNPLVADAALASGDPDTGGSFVDMTQVPDVMVYSPIFSPLSPSKSISPPQDMGLGKKGWSLMESSEMLRSESLSTPSTARTAVDEADHSGGTSEPPCPETPHAKANAIPSAGTPLPASKSAVAALPVSFGQGNSLARVSLQAAGTASDHSDDVGAVDAVTPPMPAPAEGSSKPSSLSALSAALPSESPDPRPVEASMGAPKPRLWQPSPPGSGENPAAPQEQAEARTANGGALVGSSWAVQCTPPASAGHRVPPSAVRAAVREQPEVHVGSSLRAEGGGGVAGHSAPAVLRAANVAAARALWGLSLVTWKVFLHVCTLLKPYCRWCIEMLASKSPQQQQQQQNAAVNSRRLRAAVQQPWAVVYIYMAASLLLWAVDVLRVMAANLRPLGCLLVNAAQLLLGAFCAMHVFAALGVASDDSRSDRGTRTLPASRTRRSTSAGDGGDEAEGGVVANTRGALSPLNLPVRVAKVATPGDAGTYPSVTPRQQLWMGSPGLCIARSEEVAGKVPQVGGAHPGHQAADTLTGDASNRRVSVTPKPNEGVVKPLSLPTPAASPGSTWLPDDHSSKFQSLEPPERTAAEVSDLDSARPSRVAAPAEGPGQLEPKEGEEEERGASVQALCHAVQDAQLALVQAMVRQSPALVNRLAPGDGWGALHWAAHRGHRLLVELLVRHGAEVDLSNSIGQTALHLAVKSSCVQVVEVLLKKGASPNIADPECLHLVMRSRSKKNALSLYLLNPSPMSLLGRFHNFDTLCPKSQFAAPQLPFAQRGNNPLLKQLQEEYPHLANEMQSRVDDGDVIVDSEKGDCTMLHWAAFCGDEGSVKALVKAGADLERTNPPVGCTALHLAAPRVKLAPPCRPPDDGAESYVGHSWAQEGRDSVVAVLLEAGVYPTAVDDDGRTPVHWAVERGQHGVLRQLLEVGAGVSTPEKMGWSPLHLAVHFHQPIAANMLLKAGADKDAATGSGHTPLHWAARQGRGDMVMLLLKKGADKSLADARGKLPIDLAAEFKSPHCVAMLNHSEMLGSPETPKEYGLQISKGR